MNPFNKSGKLEVTGPMLYATGFAFVMMIVLTMISSLWIAMTDMDEAGPLLTLCIHGAALFLAGASAGRKIGSKGWYYGMICGLLYSLILILIAFLAYDSGLHLYSLLLVVCACSCGMLGGMIGVNVRK
ncbi:TIGR04086 family membrane protein [Marinicrinis sediminis]|uniref:TIGR04086 family membrane protein n=1 Tax=Marinicrinis sediminis TaxID=1652465 RepID=A0ABW5R5Y1_9BACL